MLTPTLLFVAAAIPATLGQSVNITFLTGLLGSLETAGLTQLATFAQSINSTSVGQSLLANISNGSPHLLFAPTDAALRSASANVTSDPNTLADVLAYHVVPGNFTDNVPTYPNVTLGRTLLTDGNLVQLEGGNKAQVLAWATRADGHVHILNQRNDSVVVNSTSFGNVTIWSIDQVLQIPQNLATTIPADNISLTGVDTVLQTVQTPFFNSTTNSTTNTTLFNALNAGFHGFTFFAPNTTAIQSAQSSLQGLNSTQLQNLVYNHFLNGTTVYSTQFSNLTTAAGEKLGFTFNSTGQYVTDSATNTTARIVQPDVLLPNGVIHVIDRVFLDTNADASAASSAIASATSAATASQSSQTAPLGTSTPTGGSTAGGSAASALGVNWGMMVAAVGVVLGGVIAVV
ncbi:hypothetical protein EUX98_g7337 [Antrodiella citrinella]|uniref:FAS1 domain-containing protein n=1 Tax=Antrodiella citrinella TaxID=2447956 RepID=A0A4S4MM27_9APHY|nr:hypothetical protein EUX98_g7337 [Antrodiella citrinella]